MSLLGSESTRKIVAITENTESIKVSLGDDQFLLQTGYSFDWIDRITSKVVNLYEAYLSGNITEARLSEGIVNAEACLKWYIVRELRQLDKCIDKATTHNALRKMGSSLTSQLFMGHLLARVGDMRKQVVDRSITVGIDSLKKIEEKGNINSKLLEIVNGFLGRVDQLVIEIFSSLITGTKVSFVAMDELYTRTRNIANRSRCEENKREKCVSSSSSGGEMKRDIQDIKRIVTALSHNSDVIRANLENVNEDEHMEEDQVDDAPDNVGQRQEVDQPDEADAEQRKREAKEKEERDLINRMFARQHFEDGGSIEDHVREILFSEGVSSFDPSFEEFGESCNILSQNGRCTARFFLIDKAEYQSGIDETLSRILALVADGSSFALIAGYSFEPMGDLVKIIFYYVGVQEDTTAAWRAMKRALRPLTRAPRRIMLYLSRPKSTQNKQAQSEGNQPNNAGQQRDFPDADNQADMAQLNQHQDNLGDGGADAQMAPARGARGGRGGRGRGAGAWNARGHPANQGNYGHPAGRARGGGYRGGYNRGGGSQPRGNPPGRGRGGFRGSGRFNRNNDQ